MLKKLLIVLAIPVVLYLSAKMALHYRIGQTVDALAEQYASVLDLSYESVTSSFNGEVGITGLMIKPIGIPDEVRIDKASLQFPSARYIWDLEKHMHAGELPETFAIKLSGLQLDAHGALIRMTNSDDASAQPVALLDNCVTEMEGDFSNQSRLGIDTLTLDMEHGYVMDLSKNEFTLHGSVNEHQTTALDYEVVVPLASKNPMMLAASFADPTLIRAELRVTDQGYYDKLYRYCETRSGFTQAMTKTAIIDNAVSGLTGAGFVPDQRIIDDFRSFLDQHDTFVMSAKPRAPQRLSHLSLYRPEDIPDALNIHTEAL